MFVTNTVFLSRIRRYQRIQCNNASANVQTKQENKNILSKLFENTVEIF